MLTESKKMNLKMYRKAPTRRGSSTTILILPRHSVKFDQNYLLALSSGCDLRRKKSVSWVHDIDLPRVLIFSITKELREWMSSVSVVNECDFDLILGQSDTYPVDWGTLTVWNWKSSDRYCDLPRNRVWGHLEALRLSCFVSHWEQPWIQEHITQCILSP